jgi:hypothetical protein
MCCLICFAKLWCLQSVQSVSLSHNTFLGSENRSQDEYIQKEKLPIVRETVLT